MKKILLVGQAPSKDTDGRGPFTGRSGARLAALCDMERDEFLATFDLANLLDRWPGKAGKGDAFPLDEARTGIARLDLAGRPLVVLVGKQVARAFGASKEYFEPFGLTVPRAVGAGQFIDQIKEQSPDLPAPTVPAQLQGKMSRGLGAGCLTVELVPAVVIPHPSGVNRWWNDPMNVERAEKFFTPLLPQTAA